MTAYFIAEIRIEDPGALGDYARGVAVVVADHGGRFLARGGEIHAVEGDWRADRVNIIAFDSIAAGLAFYNSAEYQTYVASRGGAATVRSVIVDGVA